MEFYPVYMNIGEMATMSGIASGAASDQVEHLALRDLKST
jgi:hypothetical protein